MIIYPDILHPYIQINFIHMKHYVTYNNIVTLAYVVVVLQLVVVLAKLLNLLVFLVYISICRLQLLFLVALDVLQDAVLFFEHGLVL